MAAKSTALGPTRSLTLCSSTGCTCAGPNISLILNTFCPNVALAKSGNVEGAPRISAEVARINEFYAPLPVTGDTVDKGTTEPAAESDCKNGPLAIAKSAYQAMVRLKRDQSIIMLGETGSGKTYTHRTINRKLCEIAAPLIHEPGRSLLHKVLRFPSILNAFGCSSNWKHNTASGFGTHAEYQFDPVGRMMGVKINPFILDGSRVKADQEASLGAFRIFHMLVAGATSKERDLWGLPLQSTVDGEPHQLLVYQMEELRTGLKVLGIGGNKQARIFGILAGIYHLANLSEEDELVRVLPKVALLLGLEEGRLEDFLVGNSKANKRISRASLLDAAQSSRKNQIAYKLYTLTFTWIVKKINKRIAASDNEYLNVISVLDFPGYSISDTEDDFHLGNQNSVLSAYACERLLAFAKTQIIELPLKFFTEEKVGFEVSSIRNPLPDNDHIIREMYWPTDNSGVLSNVDALNSRKVFNPNSPSKTGMRKHGDLAAPGMGSRQESRVSGIGSLRPSLDKKKSFRMSWLSQPIALSGPSFSITHSWGMNFYEVSGASNAENRDIVRLFLGDFDDDGNNTLSGSGGSSSRYIKRLFKDATEELSNPRPCFEFARDLSELL
ncbi:hypothetical protein HDU67_001307, partial [Dinochytrium kinnereticum]